ncbi:MAG: patatin-like phospholipase family protein [Burkholderiaceae bacterium]|nr:patatin-like phospholipase family protein [Burkholderiaceae bacterium]
MATQKRKTRLPQPLGAESNTEHCPPVGDRQVVLVLQGGGALGAYQAGVYEALHEAGVEPDWVIGTSIGAITAALIVGNSPERRVERLHEFWDTVAHKGLPALRPGLPGLPTLWTTLSAVGQGLPGFFAPNPLAWLSQHLPLEEDATGYYHTAALRDTLSALVDAERLNSNAPRLTVGAVNVRSGEMRYFDSCNEALDLRHVLASGALPPAFPPVRIGNDLYWDGGIYSNTPVEAVFDDHPRRSSLVFAVQLWRAAGEAPRSMWQVSGRQKEVQFSSRVNSHVQRQAQIHQLRHIVRELTKELPAAALARPELREMTGFGCGTVMHLMRLVAPRLPDEDHTKDMDFNTPRIHARWQAGLNDGRRTLAQQAWRAPVGPMDGLVVHDLEPVN